MSTGALELKIILSSAGAAAVSSVFGSLQSRVDALGKSSDQSNKRLQTLGRSMSETFTKGRAALDKANEALKQHSLEAARTAKALEIAKQKQEEATRALNEHIRVLRQKGAASAEDLQTSAKLARAEDAARKEVERLTQAVNKNADKTRELKRAQDAVDSTKFRLEREKLQRQFEKESNVVAGLTRRLERLKAVQADIAKHKAEFNERRMNAVAAVGMGASLAAPIVASANFNDQLTQLSIIGELRDTPGAKETLGAQIRGAASRYGVPHANVLTAINEYTAASGDPVRGGNYADVFAFSGKASRAAPEDLARLAYSLESKMGLKTPEDVQQAFSILAKSGKMGQYELASMAKSFPAMANMMASFGSKGLDGIRELGAFTQVIRAGAGSNAEADVLMQNWFSHMSANSTRDKFASVGIDYEKAKAQKVMAGHGSVSNVDASFMVFDDYIDKVVRSGRVREYDSKGKIKSSTDLKAELDQAAREAKEKGLSGEKLNEFMQAAIARVGLSSVLQDMQATQAYLAYRSGKGKYAEIRGELAKPEAGTTLQKDYAEQDELSTMRWEKLKTSFHDLAITVGNVLEPAVSKLLVSINGLLEGVNGFMKENPKLASVLVTVTGAVAAFTAALMALGTAASLARLGLAAGRSIPFAGRLLGSPGSGARLLSRASGGIGGGAKALATGAGGLALGGGSLARGATRGVFTKVAGGLAKVATPLAIGLSVADAASTIMDPNASSADKTGAVGESMGSLGGGVLGMKAGAALGTLVLPGIGTAVGGVLGGIAGALSGGWLGEKVGRWFGNDEKPEAAALPPQTVDTPKPKPSEVNNELKFEYKPNITIHGDPTPETLARFNDMLRQQQDTVAQMVERIVAEQTRRAY